MAEALRSWAVDRPINSPFARPAGLAGRLAGRFMLWTNRQAGLLPVLDVLDGATVLEVGHGPGGLIRLVVARTGARRVIGVDLSPEMSRQAAQVNRAAVRAGRVELRTGTAADTGLAADSADLAVAVNSVALWPDLDAGLTELRRVVRPGGAVVLAWHGGTAPTRIVRALRLPADKLDRIERGLAERFGTVTRHALPTLDVFRAG